MTKHSFLDGKMKGKPGSKSLKNTVWVKKRGEEKCPPLGKCLGEGQKKQQSWPRTQATTCDQKPVGGG